MEYETKNKKNYFFSPKTKEEFSALLNAIQEDESLDDSMNALDANIEAFSIPQTGELVGDAVKNAGLDSRNGALLSYNEYAYYFRHGRRKKSLGNKLWGFKFPSDEETYWLISTLISWQFTQTVMMKLPSFNLSEDLHGDDIECIPYEFFYMLEGLPLYMPIKSKKYVGVMLSTASKVPVVGFEQNAAFERELVKDGFPVPRSYAMQFLLFGKDYSNVVSLRISDTALYSSIKEVEEARTKGKISLSNIRDSVSQSTKDHLASKLCLDILTGAVFLTKNLPFPGWIEKSKNVQMDINPKNGRLTAKMPEIPNMLILTPEGCVDLSDPESEVSLMDNEDRILH